MESNNVEQLLEAYFEGATTLAQEKQLRTYFNSDNIAPHLESYVPMFAAFAKASEDTYNQPIHIPKQKKSVYRWVSGVAAVAIVLMGLATQMNQEDVYQGNLSQEEGILKTKQALGLMGKMFNESTAQLGAVNEFNTTTSNFFKQ